MIPNVVKFQLMALATKYGVQIKNFSPGQVQVVVDKWHKNPDNLFKLLADLEQDPDIYTISFSKETGTLLINFNERALESSMAINRWLSIFQKYNF